jgi:hypothetical protein
MVESCIPETLSVGQMVLQVSHIQHGAHLLVSLHQVQHQMPSETPMSAQPAAVLVHTFASVCDSMVTETAGTVSAPALLPLLTE